MQLSFCKHLFTACFSMSQVNETTASVVTEFFIVGFPGLQPKHYSLIGALLFIIYIAVITGNSLIVILFVIERSLHKPMYIIMLSLSLSDIGFCTAALPKVISRYWFNDGYIGFYVCLFQRQMIHYFVTLNSLMMMIMALDRYLAICYPLRYPVLMTNRTMGLLIWFSWVTAMIAPTVNLVQTVKLPFCGPNMILHCFCDSLSMNQLACADAYPHKAQCICCSNVCASRSILFHHIFLFKYPGVCASNSKCTGPNESLFYLCHTADCHYHLLRAPFRGSYHF